MGEKELPYGYRRNHFSDEPDVDEVIVPEDQQMFFLTPETAHRMAFFCAYNPKAQHPQ